LTLSEDSKKKLKADLASYLDHFQQIKEIQNSLKEVIKDAAEILEKKPATVRKVFANLKKKYETGNDELEDLFAVVSAME